MDSIRLGGTRITKCEPNSCDVLINLQKNSLLNNSELRRGKCNNIVIEFFMLFRYLIDMSGAKFNNFNQQLFLFYNFFIFNRLDVSIFMIAAAERNEKI